MLQTLSRSFLPALLNMSVSASVVILFVLLLRPLLRRAPKRYSYLLWAAPFFRLLCPLSFSGRFSLLGLVEAPVEHQTPLVSSVRYLPAVQPAPPVPTEGVQTVSGGLNGGELAALFYLIGLAAIAAYSLWSRLHLRRLLQTAVPWQPGVLLADHLESPFVLGLLRPRIYLPSDLPEADHQLILLHEQHHIRRGDPLFKALAFGALALHWFNPLVWLAFFLLGKDMEMSCDEAVLNQLDRDVRADYSSVLLRLSTGRPIIAGTPVAFGEGDARSRIQNVLNWKRPRTWVTASAALACALTLAFCLLNPQKAATDSHTAGMLPGPEDTVLSGDPDLIRARGGTLLPDDMPSSYAHTIDAQGDPVFYQLFLAKDSNIQMYAYEVGNLDVLDPTLREYAEALPDGVYPVNSSGESYGSALLANYVGYQPQLQAAIGTNGQEGYVRASDLDAPAVQSPQEALAWQLTRPDSYEIPLYDSQGNNIGTFRIGQDH